MPLCGVQCDVVLTMGYKPVDQHVEFVYYYETDYFLKPNGVKDNYWAGVSEADNRDCDEHGVQLAQQLEPGTPVGQTKAASITTCHIPHHCNPFCCQHTACLICPSRCT